MRTELILDEFLSRPVKLYPGKTAIVDGDRRFTYKEFDVRVNRLMNLLTSYGLVKGDRLAIVSPNSHYYLEAFYATLKTGIILVPVNFRLKPEEVDYVLRHSGAKGVIVDYEFVHLFDDIAEKPPEVTIKLEARYDNETTPGWTNLNQSIAIQSDEPHPFVPRVEDDTVSINYTSGTTAMPKGVVLTHRNFYINAYNEMAHLGFCHEDVKLWSLPMFHCNGWGTVYTLTGLGGTHVILRFVEPQKIFQLIQDEKVSVMCMAPIVFRMILEFEDRASYTIDHDMRVVMAGAPPPVAYIEKVEKEVGWKFIQIYGLTETAPLITVSAPDYQTEPGDYERRAHAGVPSLGADIQLQDDAGNIIPQDGVSIGEICVAGNMVFNGYYNNPEETAKAVVDGYFHTGDLAVWDEVGNIHIVDRKKDVIISGGENISGSDIENVLYEYAGIAECAVIGVPHEKWGETPKAIVVMHSGQTANEADILAFCKSKLAGFKCPTSIDFVEALPRTATGKLQKFKLRDQFWKGDRRVTG